MPCVCLASLALPRFIQPADRNTRPTALTDTRARGRARVPVKYVNYAGHRGGHIGELEGHAGERGASGVFALREERENRSIGARGCCWGNFLLPVRARARGKECILVRPAGKECVRVCVCVCGGISGNLHSLLGEMV